MDIAEAILNEVERSSSIDQPFDVDVRVELKQRLYDLIRSHLAKESGGGEPVPACERCGECRRGNFGACKNRQYFAAQPKVEPAQRVEAVADVRLVAAARAMHVVCDGEDRWNRMSAEVRSQWLDSVRPVAAALAHPNITSREAKGGSVKRYRFDPYGMREDNEGAYMLYAPAAQEAAKPGVPDAIDYRTLPGEGFPVFEPITPEAATIAVVQAGEPDA